MSEIDRIFRCPDVTGQGGLGFFRPPLPEFEKVVEKSRSRLRLFSTGLGQAQVSNFVVSVEGTVGCHEALLSALSPVGGLGLNISDPTGMRGIRLRCSATELLL